MATSTYADTTTAILMGDWIMSRAKPGHQYRADPDDLDANQRRSYILWERYRYLDRITSWSGQHGQVAFGASLAAKAGTVTLSPSGTGYVCREDELDLLAIGTDLHRQSQVWEFWGAWATFDVTDLA